MATDSRLYGVVTHRQHKTKTVENNTFVCLFVCLFLIRLRAVNNTWKTCRDADATTLVLKGVSLSTKPHLHWFPLITKGCVLQCEI